MKNLIAYAFAILTFLAMPTMASEYFVTRPAFMSLEMPATIPCKPTGKGGFMCYDSRYRFPATMNVQLYNEVTKQQRVTPLPTTMLIKCLDGLCTIAGNELPLGRVSFTGERYIGAYTGYYVAGDINNLTAYRFGTGPLSNVYPARVIMDEVQQNNSTAQQSSTGKVYDIWCAPDQDFCSLDDKNLTRADLPKYMVFGKDNCYMEFCYNDNDDVVGLNPEFYNK